MLVVNLGSSSILAIGFLMKYIGIQQLVAIEMSHCYFANIKHS